MTIKNRGSARCCQCPRSRKSLLLFSLLLSWMRRTSCENGQTPALHKAGNGRHDMMPYFSRGEYVLLHGAKRHWIGANSIIMPYTSSVEPLHCSCHFCHFLSWDFMNVVWIPTLWNDRRWKGYFLGIDFWRRSLLRIHLSYQMRFFFATQPMQVAQLLWERTKKLLLRFAEAH